MDGDMYVDILQRTLIPFITEVYPDGHKFIQDNDPKHKSKRATDYIKANGVNWYCTPAESPDMNPIENLWHEMKEYIRREVKPQTTSRWNTGILVHC